jgi:DNA primase
MSVIDEIKARIDIVDLVGETVKLRRTGKNYIGFCPFHPNTRTPSFVVFPETGTWRCFGQCNEGGDIFRFVMKKENWDFNEALRFLAERAGVTLRPVEAAPPEEEQALERLRDLLENAVTFYQHHLTQTPEGRLALDYLHQRGLRDETILQFGLGYAPNRWDATLNYFLGKGYSVEDLLQVGLVVQREDGQGVYDRFRHRIMFPIRDPQGRMAGFGARVLNPEDIPKFINTPQTPLFDKGKLLYALDQARKAIRAQDQVVIVEGYLDVIALHQAGFTNVVSPMGTALTEDQLRLLKRFTRHIVLALDADAAGQKATLRGLEVARQAMDHTDELVFDARGLLHHEARLQADLRVTTLPPGQDPDEVVLGNPQAWADLVAQAKPIVIHVMETLTAERDLNDPKVKREIAAQMLPLIEEVPDAVEREDYRQRLARLLRVDERALMRATPARPTPNRQRGAIATSQRVVSPLVSTQPPLHEMETHCLRLLLRHPENLYLLNRILQQAGLNRFSPQDFEQAPHRALAQAFLQALDQDDLEVLTYIQQHTNDALREFLTTLLSPLPHGEPTPEQQLEDIARTLIKMRLARVNATLQQYRFLHENTSPKDAQVGNEFATQIPQLIQLRARLEKALAQPLQPD